MFLSLLKMMFSLLNKITRRQYLPLLLLFFFAIIPRLFLFDAPFARTPDAYEYLNIAQNIADGKGVVMSIKTSYFDDSPVVRPAWTYRPILIPFVFAWFLFLFKNVHATQVFLLFLGAVNCVLFYLLAKNFLNKNLAFLLSLVVSLNPVLLINNRMILPEVIFHFFLLICLIIYCRFEHTLKNAFFLGVLMGLTYLIRIEAVLLFLVFIVVKRKQAKYLFFLLLGFLPLLMSSVLAGIFIQPTSIPVQLYHFHLKNILEVSNLYRDYVYPQVWEFIKNNFLWITTKISSNFLSVLDYLLKFDYFSFLSILVIFLKKSILKKISFFLIFFILNIILIAFTWSLLLEPRHLGVCFITGILLLGIISEDAFKKRNFIPVLMIILTLGVYLIFDFHRVSWARNVEKREFDARMEEIEPVYAWVNKHTRSNDIISIDNPGQLFLSTRRSAISIPQSIITDNTYHYYKIHYKVNYLITNSKELIEFLNEREKKVIEIKDYNIFLIQDNKYL